jgi:hypothetical protein
VHVELRSQKGKVATVSIGRGGVARASDADNQRFLDELTVVEPGSTERVRPEDGERYLRALPANLRGSYLWAVLVED